MTSQYVTRTELAEMLDGFEQRLAKRVDALADMTNRRFHDLGLRLDAMEKRIDARLDAVEKRMDALERRFCAMETRLSDLVNATYAGNPGVNT